MRTFGQPLVFAGIAVVIAIVPSFGRLANGAESSDTVAEIRKASSSYVEALNRGNLDTIVRFWTPNGTFINASDKTHRAHELARQEFSESAAPPEPRNLTEHQSTVRLITPDVAVERGGVGTKQSGEPEGLQTSYIAVWVKKGDRWLLDYLKELHVSPPPEEGPLDDLGWMVGQWDSQSEGTSARLKVNWSDQRRFLIQKFTVQLPDQNELRGEQRIAWDPSTKQIRSWLFRSDGGFVEGVWNRQGDAWVVNKVGVTPDGEKSTMVHLWATEGPDHCWFKSINAQTGDLKLDDVILHFTRTNSP